MSNRKEDDGSHTMFVSLLGNERDGHVDNYNGYKRIVPGSAGAGDEEESSSSNREQRKWDNIASPSVASSASVASSSPLQHLSINNNDYKNGKKRVSSEEVLLELEASKEAINGAIRRLNNWINQNPFDDFEFLERMLMELKRDLEEVDRWMNAKLHDHDNVQDRVIFLIEASLLLIFPYVFCLFCKRPRSTSIGSQLGRGGASRAGRTWSVAYSVNPIYDVRYKGVNFEILFDEIESNPPTGCFKRKRRTTKRQMETGMILASRVYGLSTAFRMLMAQDFNEHDVILERAIGAKSELEVPGIETVVCPYNKKDLEAGLEFFQENVLWANAMVNCGFFRESKLLRTLGYISGGIYYGMPCMRQEAVHQGEMCYSGPQENIRKKLEFAQFVWNLPDAPVIKQFYRAGLPRVKVDHEFYVHGMDIKPADYEAPSQGTWSEHDDGEPIFARIISSSRTRRLPSATSISKAKMKPIKPGIPQKGGFLSSFSSCFCGSSVDDEDNNDDEQGLADAIQPSGERVPRNINNGLKHRDCLILHMHGGGFISGGSHAHLNYSIIWANYLNCPILSVDYRLAPQHPFPTPMLDCYRCYRWCVEHAESQLGYKPRKIILVGDSAGGNLAATICIKSIMDGYRVPDGACLVYPGVDIRWRFSPSMLWSADDRLIPFSFLECCLSAYLGPDKEQQKKLASDPLVSPTMATDEVLARFPKTRVVVGDADPLHDSVVTFTHKLARNKVDVKLKVYEGCIHGVLSFLWPVVGVKEVRTFVDDVGVLLDELLE